VPYVRLFSHAEALPINMSPSPEERDLGQATYRDEIIQDFKSATPKAGRQRKNIKVLDLAFPKA
jgi:hypothetical protein